MRNLKFLAASAPTVLAVAACSPSSSSTSPPAPASSPPGDPIPPPAPPGNAVTGAITWPDGNPAAGTQVYWHLGGYSLDSADQGVAAPVGADGSYSLGGCPCSQLTGYLYAPATDGAAPQDGGKDCWIILSASGTYTGITASPGGVINW